jgi:hypothetical protein
MKRDRLLVSALLVAAAALVASCGDRTTTGPAPAPRPLFKPSPGGGGSGGGGTTSTGLVQCTQLSSATTKQTVGPAGGTLQIGPHMLVIPPGALAAAVSIQGAVVQGSVNAVKFKPSGLTFLTPAHVVLSYANCNTAGLTLSKTVAYTTDSLAILYFLPSSDDATAQQVTASIYHFSNYAVAW